MSKIRISAVRYANTYPLLYGLRESGIEEKATIEIDHPAECARKLAAGEVDISLVPIAALPDIKGYKIISDYCIGTNGAVRTVLLLTNSPFSELRKIFLDYRSRTSVALTRILAKKYWKTNFEWEGTGPDFDFHNIGAKEGLVLIGDQCFNFENRYPYRLDLALEWNRFTGLPFVFACWAATKEIDKEFLEFFNKALTFGASNIESAASKFSSVSSMPPDVLISYLHDDIDFRLNEDKKMAMNRFFDYLKEIIEY
ncbi:MAG TPA: menaquinone biosynthesis protein [Bacteroidales bacterium]|nr:menaquinone biosynthesis protein [Bacteroidales bacterium]